MTHEMASSSNGEGDDSPSWVDICNRHAHRAAAQLAAELRIFIADRPSSATSGSEDFSKKFCDSFSDYFEAELKRRDNVNKSNESLGGVAAKVSSDSSDCSDRESPKTNHKRFFRRLSFKGLTRGKGLFHKQHSDEVELSERRVLNDKHEKIKLAKIIVECRKEGIVNYLTGENMDGKHKWEKCRLALVKTTAGYMLEFYSPPKAVKPRSGVFCFLIIEARETTALEMPDHENTFMLKAENNMEYVIEGHDADDMRSWLATITYCMRSTLTDNNSRDSPLRPRSGTVPESPGQRSRNRRSEKSDENDAPELPPRILDALPINGFHSLRPTNHRHSELNVSPRSNEGIGSMSNVYQVLLEYPWYHGALIRSEAAHMVLQDGPAGHGVFLVRLSETRNGELVLTFNFQGRAKHLRMTVNTDGQCRVQHLWFQTIFDMLEHFRIHPIPLESGGASDVTLTEFVMSIDSASLDSSPEQTPFHTEITGRVVNDLGMHSRAPQIPETREITTNSGSIRMRTESLERLQSEQQLGVHGRAVENTYSFV
uniref:SH2 domain-containing protein n=1 Tax=Strigamia maritima TaxID=126957 RepID=T1IQ70_STRMM